MSLLVVGCGYVGLELARQWRNARLESDGSAKFFALTRDSDRSESLRSSGVEPIVGHWLDSNQCVDLPPVDSVLISVPHREDRDLAQQSHVIGLKNLLGWLPRPPRRLIYLSTTGVYGDAHDEVDERTPVQPTRIGPQIAVAAEEWLQSNLSPPQLTIVRLAGIYGPGRIPLAAKLKSGEPLQVPQSGYLNLVHVSDIATMLLRMFEAQLELPLYVFSDGNPVERMTFYRELANLCGASKPRFADPDPAASRSQRAGAKRVNPTALVQALKLTLRFPTYREGLIDCLK